MLPFFYRFLTDLGSPVLHLYLRRRLRLGKEDPARLSERFGISSTLRPEGALLWIHAASVGESVSALPLIQKLHERHPALQILLTTGTVTAARLMQHRLPPWVFHQYVPLDRAPYIQRFLDHWRPSVAFWLESELWPNTLAALKARKIPVVLINGSLSERSFRRWRCFSGWAKEILSAFSLCLVQSEADKIRFDALGAERSLYLGNLKYAAPLLPYDPQALDALQKQTTGRVLWLAASTHTGEEELALDAQQRLIAQRPEILLCLAPRHPVRGDAIAAAITKLGFVCARRSKGDPIRPETQIYLVDTMGELGLFYRLCPVSVLGGSFVPIGGHNLIEPAQLGTAILVGPYMQEYAEITAAFLAQGALVQLNKEDSLASAVLDLVSDSQKRTAQTTAAQRFAESKKTILDSVIKATEELTILPIQKHVSL